MPPVGELRWKEPVPADADDGIYEAYYFGKSGLQTETPSERASYYAQGEDCLTLNVWTSDETQTSGKPVMERTALPKDAGVSSMTASHANFTGTYRSVSSTW